MALARRCSALVLLLAPAARADLPVHCVRHQLLGDWEFTLGQLGTQRSSCGHQHPDNQAKQPATKLDGASSTRKVTLSAPNIAATDTDANGRWTMIYDEGFEVRVDGLTLFAFSKFDLWNEGGQQKNMSHCGETMLGWYQSTDRKQFGCYHGKRTGAEGALSFLQMHQAAPGIPPKSVSYDMAMDAAAHETVVNRLNLLQTGWTAKAYDHMIGKTPRQLNAMAGIRRTLPLSDQTEPTTAAEGDSGAEPEDELPSPVSFMATKLRLRREQASVLANGGTTSPAAVLPDHVDWRNVDGKSYLEPVIDQGDCGSCYTVSTVRMLSARNKIKAKDSSLMPFSISFPLYCAEYNQGCDGGYAFLTTKWSADVGLVPATCAAYTTSGSCSIDPGCLSEMGTRYRANNHRYVGGYYGGASEAAMMQEIVQGGPIVVSLEPKSDFMYYNGGIYKSVKDEHLEWERVDHAVLLVGYGEENGQKYWVVQNSWGPDWGEGGFFRMARGENDSGIESIAVSADVVEDDQPQVLQSFVQAVL